MRVLMLTPVFPPATGGLETLAGQLVEHLDADVLVVTADSRAGDHAAEPSAAARKRVIYLGQEPRGGRRAILALNARSLLNGLRWRPDVTLSMHVRAGVAGLQLRARGVPLVHYVLAKEVLESKALAREVLPAADRVIAISQYSRDLAAAAGARPERTSLVLPGVHEIRSERGSPSGRPTLVTVARLEDSYKGHDKLLEALPHVRERFADVRWRVIGDGRLREGLQRRASSLGLDGVVQFLGRVSDAQRDAALREASVFVMPVRPAAPGRAGEGFGMVFLEASAHGVPVIGGRTPGVVDAVLDGQTGLLVDPDDPRDIADAIITVLTDQQLAERLGAAGRSFAAEHTWPRVTARVQAVLDDAVMDPPRQARPRLTKPMLSALLSGPDAA